MTEMFGEHYWTKAQTNYDLIRKRTADLMHDRPCLLFQIPDQMDEDGVKRDWYELQAAQP